MEQATHILERLDKFESKFEQKLDKLTETILTVARIEERQMEQSKALERSWAFVKELELRINNAEEEIVDLKLKNTEQDMVARHTSSNFKNIIYPILTGSILLGIGYILGNL